MVEKSGVKPVLQYRLRHLSRLLIIGKILQKIRLQRRDILRHVAAAHGKVSKNTNSHTVACRHRVDVGFCPVADKVEEIVDYRLIRTAVRTA